MKEKIFECISDTTDYNLNMEIASKKFKNKEFNDEYNVYISDKDSLVFEMKKFVNIANDSLVKANLEDFKRKKNLVNRTACYYNCFTDYFGLCTKDVILDIKRFIVTKDLKCYLTHNKRIFRIKNEKSLTCLFDFIERMGGLAKCLYGEPIDEIYKISNEIVKRFKDTYPLYNYLLDTQISLYDLMRIYNQSFYTMPKQIKKYIFNYLNNNKNKDWNDKIYFVENVFIKYNDLIELELKDTNVILSFVKNTSIPTYDILKAKKYFKKLKKFYKNTSNNPEVVLYKRFASSNNFNYYIFGMLDEEMIIERKYKDVDISYLPDSWYKLPLKDLHDKLSKLLRGNRAIIDKIDFSYSSNVLDFQRKIDDYEFILPKNSIELVRLAQVMNNCVAGYNTYIQNGSSIIVYACKNQKVKNFILSGESFNDDLKRMDTVCIELSPYEIDSRKIVRQYYGYSNRSVELEAKETLNKYFNSIGYEI